VLCFKSREPNSLQVFCGYASLQWTEAAELLPLTTWPHAFPLGHEKFAPFRALTDFFAMPAPSSSPPLTVIDWGRTEYGGAWRRQSERVAQRILGESGDSLIFTEHEPVFTLGMRAGADSNLIWNEEQLTQKGIAVAKTNRGGDITYHGPGQIVGYPIISLASHKDLHAYLRFLEQVLIDALKSFGLTATRREGKTGIWLGQRKIAAIGVAVRRWVTYHGFALNVNTELSHFDGIIPCGISASDGSVTSMQAEFGRMIDCGEVRRVLAAEFAAQLPALLQPVRTVAIGTAAPLA